MGHYVRQNNRTFFETCLSQEKLNELKNNFSSFISFIFNYYDLNLKIIDKSEENITFETDVIEIDFSYKFLNYIPSLY